MGYIETLFGHQAPVLGIDALHRETAVSVGGRDKSVRYWNDKLMETLSWNQKRFLTSFPQLKFTDTKKFNQFKNRWIKKRRES